jgi:hypothetical protein
LRRQIEERPEQKSTRVEADAFVALVGQHLRLEWRALSTMELLWF